MRAGYLVQTELLLKVLPIIRDYPDFALKGGTALNYFLYNLPRLSVDIDLQYLPVTPYDQATTEIHRQMNSMCEGVKQLLPGSQCQYNRKKFRISIRHRRADIKIEINNVIRGQVFEPSLRSLAPELEDQFDLSFEVNCLHRADLYAGKLCAALDRQHPRDLFDIRLLLGDSNAFDWEIIIAFIVYLAGSKKSIRELLDPRPKEIAETFQQKFEGMARDQVTVADLEHMQAKLPGIIHAGLTEADKQFLLGFKWGEPDWNLLPVTHARSLPAVLWKMHNLEQMDDGSRQQAITKLEEVLNRPSNIDAGITEQAMEAENKTPSQELAEKIAHSLLDAQVIDESRQKELVKKIVSGEITAEEWTLGHL